MFPGYTLLVFIFYLCLFCWLITRIRFFTQTNLGNAWLIVLFVIKVAAGIYYGKFYAQDVYISGSDTWHFYNSGLKETDWLLKDPLAFIKDIFSYGYSKAGNVFIGKDSYWNDLKSNIIIKLMAVCNVFTGRNYYVNVIFFNFLFFFGPVAIYKLCKQVFSLNNSFILMVVVFLIPSFLFWCSGIHKDGLIFTCIGVILYFLEKVTATKKIQITSIAIMLCCFLLLMALRIYVALALVPAVLVYVLINYYKKKSLLITVIVYSICIALFFTTKNISAYINFPSYMVEKQTEFKQLAGNSVIPLPPLEPTFKSFIQFIPSAIDVALFRPHAYEIKSKAYLLTVIEIYVTWLFMLYFIFQCFRNKNNSFHTTTSRQRAFILCSYCFACTVLLIAGYTITFSGAIIRYRSIAMPFLIIIAVCILLREKHLESSHEKRNNTLQEKISV